MEANAYISGLASGFSRNKMNQFNRQKILQIRTKLEYLMKNANNLWHGVDKVENLQNVSIATGWGFSISRLNQDGEKWRIAYPQEGTTGWIDNWLIGYSLKNKPLLKQLAEEWINNSLDPKVQAHYSKTLGQFPVNSAAKKYLSDQEIKKYHLNDPNFIKNEIILWPTLIPKEQSLIRSIGLSQKNTTQ